MTQRETDTISITATKQIAILKELGYSKNVLLQAIARNFEEKKVRQIEKSITIDLSTPFDPETFIGSGWSIVEEDEKSLALAEIDLDKLQLVTMLQDGETCITGEEKLRRLKNTKHIRLDAKVFQTLWENQDLIPESWKEKTNGYTTYIFFDGTILRNPRGSRYALFLFWSGGRWDWRYHWLDYDWSADAPSAVLEVTSALGFCSLPLCP